MTCIDFACGFTKQGEEDTMKKQMNDFMNEEVDFEMPEGALSWKQSVEVKMEGMTCTKIVTRIFTMNDGTEQPVKKEFTREITP